MNASRNNMQTVSCFRKVERYNLFQEKLLLKEFLSKEIANDGLVLKDFLPFFFTAREKKLILFFRRWGEMLICGKFAMMRVVFHDIWKKDLKRNRASQP